MENEILTPKPFKYERPELTRSKAVRILDRSDILVGVIQVVQNGGETNLHSHPHVDSVWFVLSGRARFYTTDDVVIADLSKYEGILIPRGYRYWFESVGDEILEIFQAAATDDAARLEERENHTPMREGISQVIEA